MDGARPKQFDAFTGMPEDDERRIMSGVLSAIEAGTGKKPRGWLGPALTETPNTLDLLAEAGIEYVPIGVTTSCRIG